MGYFMLQVDQPLTALSLTPQRWDPDCNDVSDDFGHILQGAALAIARPTRAEDVVSLIQVANRSGLVITPRGKGYSQSGQSVSLNGISLDTSHLTQLDIAIDQQQVTCGSGLSWRQVMMAVIPQGFVPCVMPLNLNLTIGGTLAAGGIGSNSHRYGSSIANVTAMDVVTGSGELIHCSASQYADLFQAILGGQGRCAVVVAVTLKLRSFKAKTQTYQLMYRDLDRWLADQQILKNNPVIDHMEGFCLSATTDTWQYKLLVAIEFDPATGPAIGPSLTERPLTELPLTELPLAELPLAQLNYDELVDQAIDHTPDFLARYDSRFQSMRQTGDWQKAHPWFECLLPLSAATHLIPEILKTLPACFGDGHRVIQIDRQSQPKFFMPHGFDQPTLLFAALPTGISVQHIEAARSAIKALNQKIMQYGGKRYLSGWLEDTSQQFWQQHFGPLYVDWIAAKKKYDQNQVLGSLMFQGDPHILN
jgi:cytokinin dehydrogenase